MPTLLDSTDIAIIDHAVTALINNGNAPVDTAWALDILKEAVLTAETAINASDTGALIDAIDAMQTAMDGITDTIDDMDAIEDGLRTDLTAAQTSISSMATSILALQTSDASQNTRLTAIEAKNTTQDGQLTSLASTNTSQDSSISAIQSKDTTQDSQISGLTSTNTTQDSAITAIQTKNTTQDGQISSNTSTNSAQDTAIAAIQSTNTAQDAAIAALAAALLSNAPTSPSRSLNTAFRPSTTRPTDVSYSVPITAVAALVAGQRGKAYLRYADDSGMTTNVVTVSQDDFGIGSGLVVTAYAALKLIGRIPANKWAMIVTENTVGTPTFGAVATQESTL